MAIYPKKHYVRQATADDSRRTSARVEERVASSLADRLLEAPGSRRGRSSIWRMAELGYCTASRTTAGTSRDGAGPAAAHAHRILSKDSLVIDE